MRFSLGRWELEIAMKKLSRKCVSCSRRSRRATAQEDWLCLECYSRAHEGWSFSKEAE